jgi:hypothetical protein
MIRSFRPQADGQRKYKMGTARKFMPQTENETTDEAAISGVFDQFFYCQQHLKNSVIASRDKAVGQRKLVSAIGPIVRFYLPEAFDFLISHEERHLQQGREVLAMVEKGG